MELPKNIQIILQFEGVSALCWKRFRDLFKGMDSMVEEDLTGVKAILAEAKAILSSIDPIFVTGTVAQLETSLIKNAYLAHSGDVVKMSKSLGLAKTTLYRRMTELNLRRNVRGRNRNPEAKYADLKKRIENLKARIVKYEKMLPKGEGK